MEKLTGKILFIKPFEVDSSGTSFIEVWRNIKKALRGSEGNRLAVLLRSMIDGARFGFVSLSAWDSILLLRKAVRASIIIKYHISGNGSENRSDLSFVYKVIDSRYDGFVESKKEIFMINFVKSEKDIAAVRIYWNGLTDQINSKCEVINSLLCKSVSGKSEYPYVFIMNMKLKYPEDFQNIIRNSKPVPGNIRENILTVYESKLSKNTEIKKYKPLKLNK